MKPEAKGPCIEHRILAVDDYADSLDLFRSILTQNVDGVTMLTASSGLEGIEVAKREQPDLILLDVQMPGLDGFEVCTRLKADHLTSSIPVLMVSGAMVASGHRSKGLTCGAEGYICKPFEKEELVAQARMLLRVKHYQDQLREQSANLEEKLAERTRHLCEREEQLRLMFDNSPDAIFVEDFNGTVLDANPAACLLHGLSHKELIGTDVMDLVPPDQRARTQLNQKNLLHGTLDRVEGVSRAADGRDIPVEVRSRPFTYRGQKALLLHVRDITERKQAEEELRASEKKFSSIFHHSNDPILVHDLHGDMLDVNAKAIEQLGYTREDLLGMNLSELHPATTREQGLQQLAVMAEQGECCFESEFKRADGSTFPAEVSASLFQEGHRVSVQGVVHDLTERKKAEERQRSRTEGLRAIVEAADELMRCNDVRTLYRRAVELGREKLRLERCAIFVEDGDIIRGTFGTDRQGNTTEEDANVQSKNEFWTKRFEPLNPGESPCRVVEDILSEWDGEKARLLTSGWVAITPIVRTGERPTAVFSNDTAPSGTPIDMDRQEIVAVYCSLLGEIIERKRAEERLREAEHKYRTLVEQLPAVTYVVDLASEGRTRYISPQVESLLGFTPAEWLEQHSLWSERIHSDDRDRVLSSLGRANRRGESYSLVYRVLAKDGRVLWFRNHGVYLHDETGKPKSIHGIMLDITDRKAAEQRERDLENRLSRAKRMESLGLLAGGVAHDLNNILGPLVAYPDLILEELPEGSPVRDDVGEIGKSAKRAADVIQDLLSLARRGSYQLEPIRINDVIQSYVDAVDFHVVQAQHPDIRLELELDEKLPPIQGSAPHLGRVVANLLTNAFEAMPQGEGSVTISTHSQYVDEKMGSYETVKSGDYVILSIRDTGEGIEEEDVERIFEPFYTKRKLGRSGTGLGLAVVYGVIRDLSGHIDVRSTPGEGTEFVVYFPASVKQPDLVVYSEGKVGGTESVLVVDDVKEQRELAARVLAKLGYRVTTAENGRAAVDYVRKHRVDMVVLDMIMEEDFDGLDTYREIIRIHPGLPCLIASGFAETDRVREAQVLGAGGYIRKPYTTESISHAVRQELDRASA